MTYESASEADVLKYYWRPGAALENTVFAILDPYGRPIIRGGRSPKWVFRDSSEMAKTMNEISRHYGGGAGKPDGLPSVDTVRLAIDVAACDKRPLVIVVGQTSEERQRLAQNLAPVAWSDQFIGKLVYSSGSSNDLRLVRGVFINSGYIFVSPNLFGTEATTISQLGSNASAAELARAAQDAISRHCPQVLSHHEHVRKGHMEGIEWQSAETVK